MKVQMHAIYADNFSSLANRIHGQLELLEAYEHPVISVITHTPAYPAQQAAVIYFKEKA